MKNNSEPRICVTQILDPISHEELCSIYNSSAPPDEMDGFIKTRKLTMSQVLEEYGDILTIEQKLNLLEKSKKYYVETLNKKGLSLLPNSQNKTYLCSDEAVKGIRCETKCQDCSLPHSTDKETPTEKSWQELAIDSTKQSTEQFCKMGKEILSLRQQLEEATELIKTVHAASKMDEEEPQDNLEYISNEIDTYLSTLKTKDNE